MVKLRVVERKRNNYGKTIVVRALVGLGVLSLMLGGLSAARLNANVVGSSLGDKISIYSVICLLIGLAALILARKIYPE